MAETQAELGATIRILTPAEGVYAYYDGRIPGVRAYSAAPNWLDDGAYEVGIASYALVSGEAALVYDTHISEAHARLIRSHLEGLGVRDIRVVLSHWHDDHVAGNAVFRDCEIIANRATADLMAENRVKLETGTPPIAPLVMPTRLFENTLSLSVGSIDVELHQADIHSRDGTLLWIASRRLLLCGDTLEDTVTFVSEAERLAEHLRDLQAMPRFGATRILPNHGAEAVIAAGGYDPSLIAATERYVRKLLRCPSDPALAAEDLRDFIADDLASGALTWFEPYAAVHRANVEVVLAAAGSAPVEG
ncbi:MBL fold metallo-hydrolase [Chthonobacter albigriseus]|uniref:MBL fold metallo-hydrolase n=1 Tax=Chthonobacter albigriseus TaxID=1683161 RepID=UPI0015EE965C|nr:MBL fold metallo-hydrolase [Chthonobacter albigriseus]